MMLRRAPLPGSLQKRIAALDKKGRTLCSIVLLASFGLTESGDINADGIPEPALVLYGSVTNTAGAFLLTSSGVNWTSVGAGSSASVSSTIASVNGQFFYVARIPFETRLAGNLTFTPSPNTLPLTATPAAFIRSATVNGIVATLAPSASTNFAFSKADRGRIERVDLLVHLPTDPELDSDGDGMSDQAEAIAGTDPKDANSVFKASTDLQPAPGGGFVIQWSSVAGRTYSIHRTTDLVQGFTPLSGSLAATPPSNAFTDTTATTFGPFFYRIQVDP